MFKFTSLKSTQLQSTRTIALSSGCLAALGWGLTGTFVKLLPQFTTLEVLAMRLTVAFLAMLPLLLFRPALWASCLALLRTSRGLLLSSLMVFYYLFAVRAFQLAPVSDVVLIVGLSPLLGLAVKLGLRQPLAPQEGGGAIVAFGGLVLFVFPRLQGYSSEVTTYLTGLGFAFLSAVISLSYAMLFQRCAKADPCLNPVLVGFTTFTIGTLLLTPFVMLTSSQLLTVLTQPHWISPQTIAIAIGLGLLSTVMPTLCYSYAAKYLSPILTTALNLLTPIFAAAIAIILLREQFPFWSMVGAAFVLVGIMMLSMPRRSLS